MTQGVSKTWIPVALLLLSLAQPKPHTKPTATPVTVNAKANIFGAGHHAPPAPGGGGGGELPPSISLHGIQSASIEFSSIKGKVSCCGGGAGTFNGPDGGGQYKTDIASTGGIAGIIHHGRSMFLVGVFLDDHEPADPSPARLDFTNKDNFKTLSPQLRQVFFIGDGLTGTGTGIHQVFMAPAGATRLFLGFADASSFGAQPGYYSDNVGELKVSALITPGSAASSNPGTSGNTGSQGSATPNLTGQYVCFGSGCSPGTATITQNGSALALVNERGSKSRGHVVNASTIIADDWQGGLRGTVDPAGNKISWANGTSWLRSGSNSGSGSSSGVGSSSSSGTPAGFQGCNRNSGSLIDMSPCFGPEGTTITLVVRQKLPSVLDGVVFKQGPGGTGSGQHYPPANVAITVCSAQAQCPGTTASTNGLTLTSGNGIDPGSVYTLPAPPGLCRLGGGRSAWDVWLLWPGGKIQGDISYFSVQCP